MKKFPMMRAKIKLINKLTAYFESTDLNFKEKNLCVCLSGGADSVALLRSTIMISERFGFGVSACHFNHMIRGEEADRDEEFCKLLCKKLNVKLYCGSDDVPAYAKLNKISMETAARECRYAFFERIYSKKAVDYCLTAHNMNDNAETLLFNLIRGSGSNGASAIASESQFILRPLLKISRSEIEDFLVELEQDYVTDSTNASTEYTRNYIRSVLMPHIEKINPSATEAISRYIESCKVDRDYFEKIVEENLDADLRVLHKAVRDRVILRKYKDFSGKILNSDILFNLEKALFTEGRSVLPIFGTSEAIVQNGRIDFFCKEDVSESKYAPIELSIGENSLFSDKVIVNIYNELGDSYINVNKMSIMSKISFDNIIGKIYVRNRQIGDKIRIFGLNKSLKKLFNEKKIPKEYRDTIPVFFDEDGIIYVPFIGMADRVYPKANSNIIYIQTIFNTFDKERWSNTYEE